MNKKEFIKILDKKLSGLDKAERLDIINEYTLTIEESILSGKSEEEAILGFGDINIFISEVLDIYKVDKFYFISSLKNKMLYNLTKTKEIFNFKKLEINKNQLAERCKTKQVKKSHKEQEKISINIFTKLNIFIKNFIKLTLKTFKSLIQEVTKAIIKLSKICIILGITFLGLFLGFILILTILGFPTIGLVVACLGSLVAMSIILKKSKILYFLVSVVLVGSGVGISTIEAFSLERENYSDYLEIDYKEYKNTYKFNPNHEIYIGKTFSNNMEIILDEAVPEGEIEINTLLDSEYCYIYLYMHESDTEEFTNITVNRTLNNTYSKNYLQTAFWQLKENKMIFLDQPDIIKNIEIRVNPNIKINK